MHRVAGVTVLYNPDNEVIANILSYQNQIEKLFIVDNSETENTIFADYFSSFPNICFISNKKNIGIAAALNKAAQLAITEDYNFLLTMDQDSKISDDLVKRMLTEFDGDDKIGLIAPFVIHIENPKKPFFYGLEEITVAMTSGCIIRLSVYKKTGGFLEKFFIDYVDNEFCLRVHLAGFKVMQLNSVYLYHRLGSTEPRKLLFTTVFPTNHPPFRWYYRTRNRLFVYEKYGGQFRLYMKYDKKVFLKDFLKILLYEPLKMKKIKMILHGYKDYKRNKFGKFTELN